MGKDNTDEIIRQIQETRKQLTASLYDDFFGGSDAVKKNSTKTVSSQTQGAAPAAAAASVAPPV